MKNNSSGIFTYFARVQSVAFLLMFLFSGIFQYGYAQQHSMENGPVNSVDTQEILGRGALERVKEFLERGQLDVVSIEKDFGIRFEKYESVYNEKEFGRRENPAYPNVEEWLLATSARPPFSTRCGKIGAAKLAERSYYFFDRTSQTRELIILFDLNQISIAAFENVFSHAPWQMADMPAPEQYSKSFLLETHGLPIMVRQTDGRCFGVSIRTSHQIGEMIKDFKDRNK